MAEIPNGKIKRGYVFYPVQRIPSGFRTANRRWLFDVAGFHYCPDRPARGASCDHAIKTRNCTPLRRGKNKCDVFVALWGNHEPPSESTALMISPTWLMCCFKHTIYRNFLFTKESVNFWNVIIVHVGGRSCGSGQRRILIVQSIIIRSWGRLGRRPM